MPISDTFQDLEFPTQIDHAAHQNLNKHKHCGTILRSQSRSIVEVCQVTVVGGNAGRNAPTCQTRYCEGGGFYGAESMATYLITGANRGIGYEYCKQLHERGDTAISVCRTSSPELDALGIRIEADVDITDDASVAHLVKRLQGIALDVLINNAGIIHRITLDNLDFESIREQFEVNTLGALRLTRALLPNLKAGSKIILMTSRMGSIDDNTSGGSYGYRMSKRIFGNT